jgi:hypothetical protein
MDWKGSGTKRSLPDRFERSPPEYTSKALSQADQLGSALYLIKHHIRNDVYRSGDQLQSFLTFGTRWK